MENYIVINGKKAELTDEQLKQLGIKIELKCNNPFGEIEDSHYFYIGTNDIGHTRNIDSIVDEDLYNNVNHFNDKDFANQVMVDNSYIVLYNNCKERGGKK